MGNSEGSLWRESKKKEKKKRKFKRNPYVIGYSISIYTSSSPIVFPLNGVAYKNLISQ